MMFQNAFCVAEEDVQRLQAILYVLALKVLGKEGTEKSILALITDCRSRGSFFS